MSALAELLQKYKSSVSTGSEVREHTYISIGPLSLNLAIGDPRGVQSGKIVQLVGKYSSGKSTLALDTIAQHQRAMKLPVIYVDFERAYDRDYARSIGVDTDLLQVVRADDTESGLDFAEKAIKTRETKLVVIDSIASAKPSSENAKDFHDAQKMGGNSGIISRFVNRIVPLIDNYDVLVLVLNQLRANFNTLAHEKEIPYGAKALHYATSVMIQLVNISTTETETEIEAYIKKNRVGSPRHKSKFFIRYGLGIDHAQDIIQLAIDNDIVRKSGSWVSYKDKKIQGMERAADTFPIEELRELLVRQI